MYNVKELTHAFGDHVVFDRVSFEIPKRGLVAVTGVNGIGKTTLLRILGGLYKSTFTIPYTGWATYLDAEFLTLDMLSVDELVNLLGCQGESLNGDELRRNPLIDESMRLTRVGNLSLGQRQRLVIAVATALLAPALLLLDEPLNGLDEVALAEARAQLKSTAQRRTVLLATHNAQEITKHSTHVLRICGPSTITLSCNPSSSGTLEL